MTRKDPAVLWFGSAFYEDEHVLQMTYEQQGVYQRLLWIAFQNGGIPADEAVLARMLGLAPKRFARIWGGIRPCWQPGDVGRLVQPRQEEERARRAAAVSGDNDAAPDGVSDRMRQLARLRWDRHRRTDGDAEPHAARSAARSAETDASRNAAPQCEPQSPPAPPSVPSEAKYPRTRNADAHCAPAGASAARADAEPEPEIQLQLALLRSPYRSNLPGFDRSRELRRKAQAFLETGLTPADVADLVELDRQKADQTGALLATWLDANTWREVLDEQKAKRKERAVRARGSPGDDDLLDGVYGTEPSKSAGSVVGDAMKGVRVSG